MRKFIIIVFMQVSLLAPAQIKLDVFTPNNPNIEAISVYSSPGKYNKEQKNKISSEIFYFLTIIDKQENYFRVVPEDRDRENRNDEYGFYGWVHRGDVYVIIQNYTNTQIPLYTNPIDKIPTGVYIYEDEYAAVYDISGNYVLVHLISDSNDYSDDIWGWVHKCHLNGNIYTTDTRIDNIEY